MHTQPTPLAPLNNRTPERAFLAKNYDAPTATRAAYSTRPQMHLQLTAGLAGSLVTPSFSLLAVGRVVAQMMALTVVSGYTQVRAHRRRRHL